MLDHLHHSNVRRHCGENSRLNIAGEFKGMRPENMHIGSINEQIEVLVEPEYILFNKL